MSATVRMDIQRQGNCTKRNLGRNCQSTAVGRSMSAAATAARSTNAFHTCCWDVLPDSRDALRAARAAMPVKAMSATAMVEAMWLNNVCSGSMRERGPVKKERDAVGGNHARGRVREPNGGE